MKPERSLLALLVFSTTVFAACRSHTGLIQHYNSLRPAMLSDRWAEAAQGMENAKNEVYVADDRVMFNLNLGTLYHYAGDYARSQQLLVQAEEEMRKLWTESISGEAVKMLVNEASGPYSGADYEQVLVYFYTALNNVEMGNPQDALIEARRADEWVKRNAIAFERKGAPGTLYKSDAFMLWLIGLFYEMEGSHNDAYLAYKASLASYQAGYRELFGLGAPAYLAEDIYRSGQLAGLGGALPKGATGQTLEHARAGMGEVILFHAAGEAPQKHEEYTQHTAPDGYVLSIALPKLVQQPFQLLQAEASVNNQVFRTMPAEPITTIAYKNYLHRQPTLLARAIARATVKYLATKAASAAAESASSNSKDSTGEVVGSLVALIGNVASAASENADLRSWTTLPALINVTRFWLPPGQYTINVKFVHRSGMLSNTVKTFTVDLAQGQRKILSVRSVQ